MCVKCSEILLTSKSQVILSSAVQRRKSDFYPDDEVIASSQ